MPLYSYTNDETGEIKDVYQTMNEPHIYEENGKKWRRIFAIPHANIDQKIDPFSKDQFMERTKRMSGNLGNLFDESLRLKKMRQQITGGPDAIQKKYLKEEAKKGRAGKERKKIIENEKKPAIRKANNK